MCGICGIIKFDNSTPESGKIKEMMKVMKHRGPDDEGIFIEDNVGFGFVRLSILDLSPLGHQPMFSGRSALSAGRIEQVRYVIVYNGEVYNYIELREELRPKGYEFKSNTDTEVVLNSYIEWGESCLDKFNGMWAFTIYDRETKEIFGARDRFGIKPFYYYKDSEQFIFASEITPILSIKPETKTANDQIIFDYLLTNRTNHTESTFFKDIKKLQHGHNLKIKVIEDSVKIKKWYSLSDKSNSGYKSSNEFKNDFTAAVKLQLRCDVPIGLCLSGGLDSSSIGATISKIIGRTDIHSFSAVYGKGQVGDETEFIDEFKGYIENIHFTYPTIDSFMNEMDRFVEVLEEPVPGTSEYAEYKVMKLAKDYCTVVLNGQGADEYMAGYHDLIGSYLKQLFTQLRWGKLISEIIKYYKVHKSFFPVFNAVFYSLPARLKELLFFRKNDFIAKQFFQNHSSKGRNTLMSVFYTPKSLRESFLNYFEYKFEHNLLWADKSGMHFSLETRFPFLDSYIVERMLDTNVNNIYKNGVTKVILRKAMTGVLPEKVRNRMDKVGFQTPEDLWFRNEKFQKYFLSIVNSEKFKSRPYFNVDNIERLYTQHLSDKGNYGNEIWKILHLELWFRKFIDKS